MVLLNELLWDLTHVNVVLELMSWSRKGVMSKRGILSGVLRKCSIWVTKDLLSVTMCTDRVEVDSDDATAAASNSAW